MELLWNLGCIFQDTSVIRAEASDAGQRGQESPYVGMKGDILDNRFKAVL
jgi:hypothetical protein